MKRITRLLRRYRPNRAQHLFALRVTVASLLSLAIAQFLHLPMPLWAVLTAIIVTEMSVGRSLKTALIISPAPSEARFTAQFSRHRCRM